MSKRRLFLLSLLCLGCLSACQSTVSKPDEATSKAVLANTSQPAEVGKTAPDFNLVGMDGKAYRLSDFRGKKLYIKFWASWCSICLSSLGDTEKFAQNQGDDYVVLTLVAPEQNGEMSLDEFKKWYPSLGYDNLPVLFDDGGQLLEIFGVRAYPSSVFIDSDGVLSLSQVGYMDEEQVKQTLEAMK